HDLSLGVPLVRARPQAENPTQEFLWASGLRQEGVEHLRRCSRVERDVEYLLIVSCSVHLGFDPDLRWFALAEVEPDPPRGSHMEPPTISADDVSERHRQV